MKRKHSKTETEGSSDSDSDYSLSSREPDDDESASESEINSDTKSLDESESVNEILAKNRKTTRSLKWVRQASHVVDKLTCPFTCQVSCRDLDETAEPVEFFLKFLDDQVIDLILYESNYYRVQNQWKYPKVIKSELLAWIGINFLRGYHVLPSLSHYWSTGSDLGVPLVNETMSRDRYTQIGKSP